MVMYGKKIQLYNVNWQNYNVNFIRIFVVNVRFRKIFEITLYYTLRGHDYYKYLTITNYIYNFLYNYHLWPLRSYIYIEDLFHGT